MQQTTEIEGWFLDIRPNQKEGITLWLMGMDGRHYQLRQDFPIIFYAAGKNEQLRDAWQYLKSQPALVSLSRTERCDLFNGMLTVMAIEVSLPPPKPFVSWRAPASQCAQDREFALYLLWDTPE